MEEELRLRKKIRDLMRRMEENQTRVFEDRSAVLQTHITSPAGQTTPSTSPPPVHPAINQPRTISMGSDGSAFHPALSEWAHSIAAISTPVQKLTRPVNSTGALSPDLYKTEALSKQSVIPCSQSRSLSITPWSSSVDFSSAPSGSTWVTEFPARTTNGSPTRMISYQGSSSVSIDSLQMASQCTTTTDAIGQPHYSIAQPSTLLMLPHSLSATTSTNPFVSSATDRMTVENPHKFWDFAFKEQHKEKKEEERVSLMKRWTERKSKSPPPSDYSCDNPTFVDSTTSGQSLATVHVRQNSRGKESLCTSSTNKDLRSPPERNDIIHSSVNSLKRKYDSRSAVELNYKNEEKNRALVDQSLGSQRAYLLSSSEEEELSEFPYSTSKSAALEVTDKVVKCPDSRQSNRLVGNRCKKNDIEGKTVLGQQETHEKTDTEANL